MYLDFYINDKLMETFPLAVYTLADEGARKDYIKGATNHILEGWEFELQEKGYEPRFVIKLTV